MKRFKVIFSMLLASTMFVGCNSSTNIKDIEDINSKQTKNETKDDPYAFLRDDRKIIYSESEVEEAKLFLFEYYSSSNNFKNRVDSIEVDLEDKSYDNTKRKDDIIPFKVFIVNEELPPRWAFVQKNASGDWEVVGEGY